MEIRQQINTDSSNSSVEKSKTDKVEETKFISEPTNVLSETLKPVRSCISSEQLNHIRRKVEEAIREKKTFTIRGNFPFVRIALIQRGWLEKIEMKSVTKTGPIPTNPLSMEEVCCNLPAKLDWESFDAHVIKCEKMIISRLLQNHDVDFYWNMRKDNNEWQQRLNKTKIINRFSRSLFTSKEGLCLLLQQTHWFNETGVSFVRFPRCYTINFKDQCSTFIDDFRLTACMSILKYFVHRAHKDGEFSICNDDGRIPLNTIQFAIDRLSEYVEVQKHHDLDRDIQKIWDHEWEQFLTNFQLIIHNGARFEANSRHSMFALEEMAKITIKNISVYWPQLELDGMKNIWIMKPGNKCRGKDIKLIKDTSDVIRAMNNKLKYVVQKYVERPLLIYRTKFDIRQWFMITCVQPLTIWMYRDCYLRFSSQIFDLDNFHESIHLTNHAVQHKYTNMERDKCLPDDNMWDNHTFKAYLRQIGKADKWFKVIYPGMKECIIGAMLASQDTMDRRPNTFELYGADFMIAENFTPWLIEINSCPAMGSTTSVTARMCPGCFEDVVKVVVDRRYDPKSGTGLFDLVYKQTIPQTPPYLGMTLSIRGHKIYKKRMTKQKMDKKDICQEFSRSRIGKNKSQVTVELMKNYNGPVIENLIEELHERLFKQPNESDNSMCSVSAKAHLQKTAGVQDLNLISQKQPYVAKPKSNKPVSLDRKIPVKESTSSTSHNRKNSQKARNLSPYPISSYDRWTQLETKSACTRPEENIWEKETASILKNKSILLKQSANFNYVKPKEETNKQKGTGSDLTNTFSISPMNKVLPEIDSKNPLRQNFYTVGSGYKNSCYKSVVKENIILPMGNQQNIDNIYCLKL